LFSLSPIFKYIFYKLIFSANIKRDFLIKNKSNMSEAEASHNDVKLDPAELIRCTFARPSYDNLDPFLIDGSKIDLTGKVFPEIFFDHSHLTPSKVIELVRKLDATKRSDITSLLLTQTHINNDDLDKLKELATLLPKIKEIDLRHTRIHVPQDGYTPFQWIFDYPNLESVNLCYTPLVSVEGLAFLCEQPDNILEKLIFFPMNWLGGPSWRYLVPKDRQDFVLESHLKRQVY
jgi:hypothetical protein